MNLRRNRINSKTRSLLSATNLNWNKFIQPIFVSENLKEPQETMKYVNIETKDSILKSLENDLKNGTSKFLLFGMPENKGADFNAIVNSFNFTLEMIKKIKQEFKDDILLFADLCICSYSSFGHCGLMNAEETKVLNEETSDLLAKVAILMAENEVDAIAPSDMMDGRVLKIRNALNKNNFYEKLIMSYSTKFSSSLYGPFRETCNSSPSTKLKDRKTYQIDFTNKIDAIKSSIRDESEGADILMIKPATFYLDLAREIKENCLLPLAFYHVSGEYVALEMLAEKGFCERSLIHLESWNAMQRAGGDIIISYASRNAKQWITQFLEI